MSEDYIEFLENMFIVFSKTYKETWDLLMDDTSDIWLRIPKIQGHEIYIMISRIAKETNYDKEFTIETLNFVKDELLKKYGKEKKNETI